MKKLFKIRSLIEPLREKLEETINKLELFL